MELRYALKGYGIPFDSLSISWTGNVKASYLKQRIKVRQVVEQDDDLTLSSLSTTMKAQPQLVVECPNINDISFKKG